MNPATKILISLAIIFLTAIIVQSKVDKCAGVSYERITKYFS